MRPVRLSDYLNNPDWANWLNANQIRIEELLMVLATEETVKLTEKENVPDEAARAVPYTTGKFINRLRNHTASSNYGGSKEAK